VSTIHGHPARRRLARRHPRECEDPRPPETARNTPFPCVGARFRGHDRFCASGPPIGSLCRGPPAQKPRPPRPSRRYPCAIHHRRCTDLPPIRALRPDPHWPARQSKVQKPAVFST
jgi:hypothetical protein